MSVRKSLFSSMAGNYFVFGTNFLQSVIVSRMLTPSEIGMQAISVSILAFFTVLRDFGATAYIMNLKEVKKDHVGSAIGVSILLTVPIGFILLISSYYIAQFYKEPQISPILRITSLTFFLIPIETSCIALLSRDMKFPLIAISQAIGAISRIIITVSLIEYKFGVISIAIGNLSSSIVSLFCLLLLSPSSFLFLPNFKHFKAVMSFGSWNSLTALLRTFGNQGNEMYMGKILGMYNLGLYSRASVLVNAFALTLTSSISSVSLSHFSQKIRDSLPVSDLVMRYCDIQGAVTWPFFIFLAIYSKESISILFGNNWTGATEVSQFLCIASIATMNLHTIVPSLLISSARLKYYFFSQFVAYSSRIILVVIAAPRFGIVGASAMIALSNLGLFLPYLYSLKYHFSIRIFDVFGTIFRSSMLAASVGIPSYIVRHGTISYANYPIERIFLGALGALPCFIVAIKLLNHPLYGEMANFCSKFWARLTLKFQ